MSNKQVLAIFKAEPYKSTTEETLIKLDLLISREVGTHLSFIESQLNAFKNKAKEYQVFLTFSDGTTKELFVTATNPRRALSIAVTQSKPLRVMESIVNPYTSYKS